MGQLGGKVSAWTERPVAYESRLELARIMLPITIRRRVGSRHSRSRRPVPMGRGSVSMSRICC